MPAQIAGDPAAPLREAASKGQAALVGALLAKGLPIDGADLSGRTALMLAAQQVTRTEPVQDSTQPVLLVVRFPFTSAIFLWW